MPENEVFGQAGGVLENRITGFFSSISMEFYLAHMVLFRVIEKLGLNTVLGNGWGQYLLTVVLVLAATALFAVVAKQAIRFATEKLTARRTAYRLRKG